ncbi:hypothetical protein TNCV_3171391 [Trichonephila clavipes]|nr:hypothetical protein TNCV_3171391 [Trichonephila clavipes]
MINAKKKERFLPDPGTIVLRQKDINLVTGKPFRIKTGCSSQMLINSLREDTEYLLDLGVNGMGQSNRTQPVVWLGRVNRYPYPRIKCIKYRNLNQGEGVVTSSMVVNSNLSIHDRVYRFTSCSRTSTTSSIVPAFLRSTSCGMTSARGHGAIVYCLNSWSEDRQTGRHNGKSRAGAPLTIGEAYLKIIMSSFLVLGDGDTRNRWRDGQVCPDVGQGTMAPGARRLGCVLVCYVQIGRGEVKRDFCDLPIRRNEGRVVNTPLVFKRVLFEGEKKSRERERTEGEER